MERCSLKAENLVTKICTKRQRVKISDSKEREVINKRGRGANENTEE